MALARLRIPTGWAIKWNSLLEPANDNEPAYDDLTEDLVQLENKHRGVTIDLGWLPEFSRNGRYVLKAVKTGLNEEEHAESWKHPLRVFESISYSDIRDTLEGWLEDQSLNVSSATKGKI